MMKQHPIPAALVAVVTALVLGSAERLFANGESFFIPAGRGPIELSYFARVKDAQTGRPLRVVPYVSIVDPITGIYIPFQGDSPGHFRSPDIGAAIKEVSSPPIDTSQLEITITASGYQTLKLPRIPRQSKGMVELAIRMQPKANGGKADAASSAAAKNQSAARGSDGTPTDSSKPTIFLLATCFGLAAISGVARTVGRPASRGR